LVLFPNLVTKFYKFYGCCCFVLEKYLRVWGCRDISVTVMSTEEVAFDSQQGEFFVLRSVQTRPLVQPSFLFNRYSLTLREGPGTYCIGGLARLQRRSGHVRRWEDLRPGFELLSFQPVAILVPVTTPILSR